MVKMLFDLPFRNRMEMCELSSGGRRAMQGLHDLLPEREIVRHDEEAVLMRT
jgi:hypothetical protein